MHSTLVLSAHARIALLVSSLPLSPTSVFGRRRKTLVSSSGLSSCLPRLLWPKPALSAPRPSLSARPGAFPHHRRQPGLSGDAHHRRSRRQRRTGAAVLRLYGGRQSTTARRGRSPTRSAGNTPRRSPPISDFRSARGLHLAEEPGRRGLGEYRDPAQICLLPEPRA